MASQLVPEPFATILANVLHANVMSMGWRHELSSWERDPENEVLIRRQWADAALHASIPVRTFTALSGHNVGTTEAMQQWLTQTYETYYGRLPEERDCRPKP